MRDRIPLASNQTGSPEISTALGIKGLFVTDEALLRQMQPFYEKRDERKAHARRRAPLGEVTLRRVRPAVPSELGRRGAAASAHRARAVLGSALKPSGVPSSTT
jgi:hypothetical protein